MAAPSRPISQDAVPVGGRRRAESGPRISLVRCDVADLTIRGAALTWTPGGEVSATDLAITDGVFVDRPAAGSAVLDVTGCAVIPGLVNAHHHLVQSAFRTLPGTRNVPMSDWLGMMSAAYRSVGVDPALTQAAARVGVAEGLLAGVTTVADHHLTWPEDVDPLEIADATISAAHDLGGRLVFVRGTAGDDARLAASSTAAMAERWGAVGADGMVQIATGPAGVHSDEEGTFLALGEVAAEFGLARRTQANEQVDVATAATRYGARPIELLDRWGWLEAGVTVAHLCETTTDERALIAERRVAATHAPGCDVPMGWGVAEVGEMLDVGIEVGLGTSGGGSNDAGHLLADARLAVQVSGLAGRAITARQALTMATAGSARGLGRSELGNLEPGSAGDLIAYDISGPADAGVDDPLAGLLWADPGRKPRHVVVAGRVVVKDWELVTVDAAEVASNLTELLAVRRS